MTVLVRTQTEALISAAGMLDERGVAVIRPEGLTLALAGVLLSVETM